MEFSRARPSDPFYRERERLEGERRTQAKAMYTIYEQQWSRLAALNELQWDSFPWPTPTMPSTPVEITPAAIRGYILSPDFPESIPPRSIAERVEEHIYRWHPDHLDRGLFARVVEADREMVMEGLWAVTIGLKDIQREGIRGKQDGWFTSGKSLGDIEARRREVEMRRRELNAHKIAEAAKRRATKAQLLEEEIQTKLELARVLEEEVRMKEEDIRRREREVRQREEEIKKRAEETRRYQVETNRRAEEIKKREEETRKRAEEVQIRERDHWAAQARAMESERERDVEETSLPNQARSNYERERIGERWFPPGPIYEREREPDQYQAAPAQAPTISITPLQSPPSITTSIPPPSPPSPYFEDSWAQRLAEFAERQQESFRREQERIETERQAHPKRARTPEWAINPIFVEHQRQWEVLSTLSELRWDFFPWPMLKVPSGPHEITPAAITMYIISPDRDGTRTTKERVKDHLRRWHPDRFETKLLGKVVAEERETVKVGAAVVVRSLNMILMQLNAPIYA